MPKQTSDNRNADDMKITILNTISSQKFEMSISTTTKVRELKKQISKEIEVTSAFDLTYSGELLKDSTKVISSGVSPGEELELHVEKCKEELLFLKFMKLIGLKPKKDPSKEKEISEFENKIGFNIPSYFRSLLQYETITSLESVIPNVELLNGLVFGYDGHLKTFFCDLNLIPMSSIDSTTCFRYIDSTTGHIFRVDLEEDDIVSAESKSLLNYFESLIASAKEQPLDVDEDDDDDDRCDAIHDWSNEVIESAEFSTSKVKVPQKHSIGIANL